MSNYEVSQLPPTLGIKDPEVKSFLDALVNAWDQRSGNIDYEDKNRFITKGEFADLANQAVLGMFSGGSDGGAAAGLGAGAGSNGGTIGEIISRISEEIKKTYLYNLLGTEFDTINIKEMNAKIDDVVSSTGAAFIQERNQRVSDIEAVTTLINAQASRIDDATSAVVSESETRATRDTALARAINTIWANVGDDSALIQDGTLAAVTPSASSASKWQQVQAAVTDPNTGRVSSTSIKQDLNSYINKTDGTLRSTWSVRVEVNDGGRAVVGGIGLSLTEGGNAGPTIDFGVRADKFWIGNTSGQGDLPFIVLTEPMTIGGTDVPAGVYIRDAFIRNASVDTLKIAGESVNKVRHINHYWDGIIPATGEILVLDFSHTVPEGVGATKLIVQVSTPLYSFDSSENAIGMRLYIDGALVSDIGVTSDSKAHILATAGAATVGEGWHHIEIKMYQVSPWNPGDKHLAGVMSVVSHGAFR